MTLTISPVISICYVVSIRIVALGLAYVISGHYSTIWLLECAKLLQRQVFSATNTPQKVPGRVRETIGS
jgi:hypothetical protein